MECPSIVIVMLCRVVDKLCRLRNAPAMDVITA
jgi:hypothetical protein